MSRPPAGEFRLFPDHYRAPYGSPAALENVGTSAAPLLAGFAFALVGLVLDKGRLIWKPDIALALLVLAGFLLVFCVQFAFNARRHYIPPGDLTAIEQIAKAHNFSVETVRQWQGAWLDEHSHWADLARRTYNLGIIALLAAITMVLVPKQGLGDMPAMRAITVGIAALGTLIELEWFLGGPRWRRRQDPQAQPPPPPSTAADPATGEG